MREKDNTVHDLVILHLHSSEVIEGAPLYVATDLDGLNSVMVCLASHHRPGKNTLFNRCRPTPSAAAIEWCKFQNVEADFIYHTGGYVDGDRPIPEIIPREERRSWVPQWEEGLPKTRKETLLELLTKGEAVIIPKCTCGERDHFEPHAPGCPELKFRAAEKVCSCIRQPQEPRCTDCTERR